MGSDIGRVSDKGKGKAYLRLKQEILLRTKKNLNLILNAIL
jgi:hypothetical protein